MYSENVDTFPTRWQIDEEYLVEATLTQKFGRQRLDIISRSDDKDRLCFLLHPGKECTKNPGRRATITRSPRPEEPFLDLVNQQIQRRIRFGGLDRRAHVLLGTADNSTEHSSHIETQ